MQGHYVYCVSSHDPLRGPAAQETNWFLCTSVEAGERWVRALYRDVAPGVSLSPTRTVVDGKLWAIDAEHGKVWFIVQEAVHVATCDWLDRPVPKMDDEKVARCSCLSDSEGR